MWWINCDVEFILVEERRKKEKCEVIFKGCLRSHFKVETRCEGIEFYVDPVVQSSRCEEDYSKPGVGNCGNRRANYNFDVMTKKTVQLLLILIINSAFCVDFSSFQIAQAFNDSCEDEPVVKTNTVHMQHFDQIERFEILNGVNRTRRWLRPASSHGFV